MSWAEQVRNLVGRDRLKEAIKVLQAVDVIQNDEAYRNQALGLNGRLSRLRSEQISGILSSSEYGRERSKISVAILDMVTQVSANPERGEESSPGVERGSASQSIPPPDSATDTNNRNRKPKTILYLAANPRDTSHLKLDEELRDIKQGLQLTQKTDLYNIIPIHAIRTDDLRRAMLTYQPHILHFSGHGTKEGKLIIEREGGGAAYLEAEGFAKFLSIFSSNKGKNLECVFLNACYSEEMADALVKSIPFVVGMASSISDQGVAIPFSVAFYDALGAGGDYAFAFEIAQATLEMMSSTQAEASPQFKQQTQ